MITHLRPAVILFALLTLLTGVLYPLAVHAVAQSIFVERANGSLIEQGGRAIGAQWIGQEFRSPRYFWGRPSATSAFPYDASSSSGSNLGPTNPALIDAVKARVARLRASDPTNTEPIPIDLVTSSASGLDPHISPASAHWQAARIARERALDVERVHELVREHVERRTFGILGEPRVNVLELNLALDTLH